MARFLRVLAVSASSVLFAAALARAQSHRFLFGVENTSYELHLDEKNETPADYKAHHASNAFAFEWSYKENFKARASLGTVTSTLEEVGKSSHGAEGFFYMSVAGALETTLESGGGLLLDLSYSFGVQEYKEASPAGTMDFNHKHTSFVVAYTFGDPDRARFYTGLAYNTYDLEAQKMDFREYEDKRFSLVGGVRARSETFSGLIEGTLGTGEIGLRVAVMFGF